MGLTRRQLLRGGAGGAALAAGSGLGLFPARAALAAPLAAPAGTTLDSTIVRAKATGYSLLTSGPGEPHIVRTDLGTTAVPGRTATRRPVLAFAQLTDIHVVDAQSPARVEYLDRYDDDPQTRSLFSAAYRPHEMLTAHVSDAIVRAVNAVRRSPVLGSPLAFTICTGDNTNNSQLNELRWQIDVLDGRSVTANSGDPATWEGVHDGNPDTYDAHYWHPEGVPAGQPADLARRLYGFPTVSGLLAAAMRPFTPAGLATRWYTAFGNHDGLAQGNFPRTFQFDQLARGGVKVIGLPAGFSQDDLRRLAAGDQAALDAALGGGARTVTADPNRRVISRVETVQQHRAQPGRPFGHGYTKANADAGTAYYTFDAGIVRGIVLDTVNPNGEADGSLDETQFAWLRQQLQAVSSRWLTAPDGTVVQGSAADRLVVVFGHHTIATMTNPITSADEPGPRVLGTEVRDLLLSFPNVVLMVDGHTHRNAVTPYLRPDGAARPGGFWEVNTASHIDWPQQARLVEIADNRDGTLSVFGTLVDAKAPLVGGHRTDTPVLLASLSRELSANDWQETDTGRRGPVEARNVELLVAAPFPLPDGPPATVPEVPRTALLPVLGAAAAAGAIALRRRTTTG